MDEETTVSQDYDEYISLEEQIDGRYHGHIMIRKTDLPRVIAMLTEILKQPE